MWQPRFYCCLIFSIFISVSDVVLQNRPGASLYCYLEYQQPAGVSSYFCVYYELEQLFVDMCSRDVIFELRSVRCKLSAQVRSAVQQAGCGRTYRGRRAGRHVQARRHRFAYSETSDGEIPVLSTNRRCRSSSSVSVGGCVLRLHRRHRVQWRQLRQHVQHQLVSSNLITINCRTDRSHPGRSNQSLSCCVINACSLKKPYAVQLLTTEINSRNVDVAAVTETWLNKSTASTDLNVPGYKLYRNDRLRRKGGGVCIYVRDCLVANVISLPSVNDDSYRMHELLYLQIYKQSDSYLFMLVYHPPKPKYKPNTLQDRLINDVEFLTDTYPTAIVYLTGDFNRLNTSLLLSETGLQQVVTDPTRGPNTLDLFITNRPDEVHCCVAKSCLQTDHRGLFVNCITPTPIVHTVRSRCRTTFYDLRKQHIDALAEAINQYDWCEVIDTTDIDLAYESFLTITKTLIGFHIPQHTVTISDNTPKYITPLIKSLLRKRNKLTRKGKIMDADCLSQKIGKLITETRANQLSYVNHKDVKRLWSSVRSSSSSKQRETLVASSQFSADDLAGYFTEVATDTTYDPSSIAETINYLSRKKDILSNQAIFPVVYEYEVYKSLSQVKKTSPGPDNIPYWLFKHCAMELTPTITHIINLSLTTGKPPALWKKATITPVPKITNPKELSDFRPISVTPLLSRIVERIIVNKYILPILPADRLADQFAYRPTCSTTAALVALDHHVARHLESTSYVRCLTIDYSKAFDCISHPILFNKLLNLNLLPNISLWICQFLTGRTHSVCFGGVTSDWLSITASIVQGSGIGPCLFIIYTMDLKAISAYNTILKYADDTTLLVPQNSSVTLQAEFSHILDWSSNNKLKINKLKTKEIVFHRPRLPKKSLPALLPEIERVHCVKILGVLLSDTMSPTQHINQFISQCNQRLFLLSQLKHQGLSVEAISIIFQALILSKITYALPAFAGHISVTDINRIDKFLKKAHRRGLVNQVFNISSLIERYDRQLFLSISHPGHCLHYLLPEKRHHSMHLRPRGHDYTLTHISTTLFKNSFVNRCIFNTV